MKFAIQPPQLDFPTMSHILDHSASQFTQYTVDSWNPPMAYGSSTVDSTVEQPDDKSSLQKKTRQYSASEMNAFWSSSTVMNKSSLPFVSPDQPQRIAFADSFKISRRSRCTISARSAPPVVGFIVADEDNCDAVDCATVNTDATMCASSFNSKTVIWSLPPQSAKTTGNDDISASKLFNSMFLPQGKTRLELPTGTGTNCLDIAPDAPIILSGSSRGQIGLWSMEVGKRLVSYTGLSSTTPVWDIAWSPAAMYFATGSGDSVARLWRSDIPFPIRVLSPGEGAGLHCHLTKWHPSCQLVVVASTNHVTVHELSGPAVLFQFAFKQATAMAFSPTGYLLAAANANSLTVWETNTGTVLFQFDTFSPIVELAWSHPSANGLGDGGLKSVLGSTGVGHPVLISIEESGKMRLWDRLFVNKPSVCELSFSQSIRPLHMHFTPKNLLVVAGAVESSDLSAIEGIRGMESESQ